MEPEMTEMTELISMKIIITTIFHMFTNVEENTSMLRKDMKDTKMIQIDLQDMNKIMQGLKISATQRDLTNNTLVWNQILPLSTEATFPHLLIGIITVSITLSVLRIKRANKCNSEQRLALKKNSLIVATNNSNISYLRISHNCSAMFQVLDFLAANCLLRPNNYL